MATLSERIADASRGIRYERHCAACHAMVWTYRGRMYATREAAVQAASARTYTPRDMTGSAY